MFLSNDKNRKECFQFTLETLFCCRSLFHFKSCTLGLALAVRLAAGTAGNMDVARVAVAVCIVNAVVRLTADMQRFVRRVCAAGGIGSGTALVRKVGAAGLLAVAGTCACNLNVRAAAAVLGVVYTVGDCTL